MCICFEICVKCDFINIKKRFVGDCANDEYFWLFRKFNMCGNKPETNLLVEVMIGNVVIFWYIIIAFIEIQKD